MSDVDQVVLKVQILNSEREYLPIRIPVEPNTKQIDPRGSSADETIRAISLAEYALGRTFTFRSNDKSESATVYR